MHVYRQCICIGNIYNSLFFENRGLTYYPDTRFLIIRATSDAALFSGLIVHMLFVSLLSRSARHYYTAGRLSRD